MAPYDNSLWYIESNTHPLLASASKQPQMVNYIRPSFWTRFLELQRVMWETNAGLTERHAYDSRPLTWPVLRRGINFWTKDHRQIYLIGNPFIWYASLCAIMVYLGARAILMLRAKRGHRDFQDSTVLFYDQTAGFLTLAWGMHFVPFFAMHRQLFLHHYLPALYFSILLLAVLFDVLTSGLRPKYRFVAAMVMVAVAFLSYTTYTPITYATPWTKQACERSRLLKSWDFNCRDYPTYLNTYANFPPGINLASPSLETPSRPANASADAQGMVAQAGFHPFEQQPKKAAQSGAHSLPDGGSGLEAEDAPANKESNAPANNQQDVLQGDVKGLDQEGMEALVLQGTADKPGKTLAQSHAGEPSSAAALAQTDSPDDEVHVVPDA